MRYHPPRSSVRVFGEAGPLDLNRELEDTFDDDAEQAIIDLKQAIDAANAELLIRVCDFDRRQIARREYGLTTVGWLRRFCRMSISKASGTLKASKALALMDTVKKHALAGEITTDGVSQLTMARGKHPDAFVVHQDVFADIATYLSPAELRRAINHWEQQVDHASAIQDTWHRRQRRSVYLSHTMAGMWDLHGSLDPETGHTVNTAIQSITDPTLIDAGDHRSHPQRRADALSDICRFWLDHNKTTRTSGSNKPHITVTLDYQTLVNGASKDGLLPEIDGTPVHPDAIRRLTCDAGIVRIITDSDSQPIDIGRRVRTAPPALRRALEHRDGGCVWNGCTAPVSWCDAHHIIHWADGGDTSLANTELICRRHHTMTHEGKRPPET